MPITSSTLPAEGRRRVVVESVQPVVDGGRFRAKRCVGDEVVVEADAFTDGHDSIACVLRHRREEDEAWTETAMDALGNDRWRGRFRALTLGRYRFAIVAWVDHFATWRKDMFKRVEAGQDVAVDLRIGAAWAEGAMERSARSRPADAARLRELCAVLREGGPEGVKVALSDELATLVGRHPDRRYATEHDPGLAVVVDPVLGRYSTWYELFPRSASPEPGRHGTFADVEARLPEIEAMGFDIVYLPPIHPIGRARRKGRNNEVEAEPGAVGSPWAIGAAEGGHDAVHPELGDAKAFRRLVRVARERHGIEVALDIAFQASPDHPYATEHPEWFRARPDGTIQYAENPPKKYQDIYPFDFESAEWRPLWEELKRIFDHWIEQGVRVFRVDNPHTKPFPFWEWLIEAIKEERPDVLFLAEAFTRPKVMYRLAKLGFSQSYTYFAWRNAKWELEEYLREVTRPPVSDFFRPNFWTNTPDILTEFLQSGGRPAFLTRLVLAATIAASYGIYGPAYELLENRPLRPGSEEYLDSEKYQIRAWDLERADNLRDFITRVNRIRREHAALQRNDTLRFHPIDNDQLIAYSKHDDGHDLVLTVVNLDPHHTQSGWIELPLEELGIDAAEPYRVHDLLGDGRYVWHGARNFVELNPHVLPAHIFRIHRGVRTEKEFEYYA